jgi:hypothetical protein
MVNQSPAQAGQNMGLAEKVEKATEIELRGETELTFRQQARAR